MMGPEEGRGKIKQEKRDLDRSAYPSGGEERTSLASRDKGK